MAFDSSAVPMFCRGCGYALAGLPQCRCPECGRWFDPANRRTYRRRSGSLRRFFRPVLIGLCVLFVFISLAGGLYYWECAVQRDLRRQIAAKGWLHQSAQVGPHWLDGTLSGLKLPNLAAVRSVYVLRVDITDADLALVGRLKYLRDLEFNGAGVTDVGARHLMKLHRLEYLQICGSQITDQGLVGIDSLQRLKVLDLLSTPITDASLVRLGALESLGELCLAKTEITDAGMPHVAALPKLVSLNVSDTRITDAGVQHIARLSHLESLNLSNTGVTDRGLRMLQHLQNLKHLDIRGTHATVEGMYDLCFALPAGLHVDGP